MARRFKRKTCRVNFWRRQAFYFKIHISSHEENPAPLRLPIVRKSPFRHVGPTVLLLSYMHLDFGKWLPPHLPCAYLATCAYPAPSESQKGEKWAGHFRDGETTRRRIVQGTWIWFYYDSTMILLYFDQSKHECYDHASHEFSQNGSVWISDFTMILLWFYSISIKVNIMLRSR